MDTRETDHIEDLLPRYCEGQLSEEERRQVEEWMVQSDENYQIAKQIQTLYLATDTMNVLKQIDTEKALATVSARMAVLSGRRTWLIWMQRIAAVLFIPLLITVFIQHNDSEPMLAQTMEVRTNPGMTTKINLPDGSVVHLNSESVLRYPSQFTGGIRDVYLEGEAFFTVKKDFRKRFIVSAPHHTQVEVLGTAFNVEAFEDDSLVSTTLVEGKINFSFVEKLQSQVVTMKPGEKLVYNPASSKVYLSATTGETETAWKDGKVLFSNTPLPEALHMLAKRYHIEFVIVNDKLRNESFTGSFTHQRLDRILEVFKISSNIRWRYLDTDNTTEEKTRIEIY